MQATPRRLGLAFFALGLVALGGCSDRRTSQGEGEVETETGPGDGDTTTGDGDPTAGDGDGDPTAGDGDGDPTTGDGDPGEEPPPPVVYDCEDGALPWSGPLCGGSGGPCGELEIAPIRNEAELHVVPRLAVSSACTLHLRYDEDLVDYYSVNTGAGWSAEELEFELAWGSGDLFVDPQTHIPTLIIRDGEDTLEVRSRVDDQWEVRATKPEAWGYRGMARGPDGTLHAAYRISDEGLHYGRLEPDASEWETIEQLHPYANAAHVAVSPTGAVHLFWRYTVDEEETIFVEWKTPLEPVELVATDSVYGSIGVPTSTFVEGQPPDPLGRMHLLYSRTVSDDDELGIYYTVRTAPNVYEPILLTSNEDIPSMPEAQLAGEHFVRGWHENPFWSLISNGQDARAVWVDAQEQLTYETVCEGDPPDCDWVLRSDDGSYTLMIGEVVDGQLVATALGELPKVEDTTQPQIDQAGQLHWVIHALREGYDPDEYVPYQRTLEHVIVDLDP